MRGFGYSMESRSAAATVPTSSRVLTKSNQREALAQLRDIIQPDVVHPLVREVALQIVSICDSREDACELEAIFDCVKNGRPDVQGFERGLKYIADPNWADLYTMPHKTIELLRKGINGGDCDDHAALICALGASIGFQMGLLAYGPPGSGSYTHVLAVAMLPKRNGTHLAGLDSTVKSSSVGWLPPHVPPSKDAQGRSAKVLLAWLE